MRAQIEALAMQGAPSVSDLIEHDRKVEFATARLQSSVLNVVTPAIAFAEVSDAVALVAWLHKDALIAALDREIASEADDDAALSHDERQRREAQVLGDLLAVERDEAALIWQAQSRGLPFEHRADCAPQAILQCTLVTALRAEATGTTPGYSWDLRR